MKNVFLIIVGFVCSTVIPHSLAEDLPKADDESIQELKEFCNEVAQEDGTGELTLTDFLLKCVNEELESEGYEQLKKLPD